MEEKQEEKREIGPFEPPARMSVTLTLPELAKKLGMPDGMTVVSVTHHSHSDGYCELYATEDLRAALTRAFRAAVA